MANQPPSPTDLCNRALQMLGCSPIGSLSPPENSPNARACFRVYWECLNLLLRDHAWTFALQRFQLAAGTNAPPFGYKYTYPLPTGWRKIVPILDHEIGSFWGNPVPSSGSFLGRHYSIEGNAILCNLVAPLNVRLVVYIDDTSKFDDEFSEAFVITLAIHMCEQLTQSNTKKQALNDELKMIIDRAKFTNAIENPSTLPPTDSYLNVRR